MFTFTFLCFRGCVISIASLDAFENFVWTE